MKPDFLQEPSTLMSYQWMAIYGLTLLLMFNRSKRSNFGAAILLGAVGSLMLLVAGVVIGLFQVERIHPNTDIWYGMYLIVGGLIGGLAATAIALLALWPEKTREPETKPASQTTAAGPANQPAHEAGAMPN